MCRLRTPRSLAVAFLVFMVFPGLAGTSAQNTQPVDLARKLIGTWRLAGIEGTGRGTAAGDRPTGVIVYDNTGHMTYQGIYSSPAHKFPSGKVGGTLEEKAAAFDNYGAYWGTYTVDPAKGMVSHRVEGSVNPDNIGNLNVRFFEFQGDNRVIYYVAEDGKGGLYKRKEDTTRRLIWERIPPK